MNWWETLLISLAVSIVTLIITIISNSLINRNKKLQFFIKKANIYSSGYFRFDISIFNPAKIPQFYDTLNVSFYSGKKRLGTTRLETTDENRKNSLGELQCFFVPSNTIQANSLICLVVCGSNKSISNADKIKIEYNTYWTNLFKKRRLVSIDLLNESQIKELIDNE